LFLTRYWRLYPYFAARPTGGFYSSLRVGRRVQPEAAAADAAGVKTSERIAKEAAREAKLRRHISEIAKAFVAGDYSRAASCAMQALSEFPDDSVLPFIYAQALTAEADYVKAAAVIREAVHRSEPQQLTIFPVAELYPDQDILLEQIEKLSNAATAAPSSADLQLLLGYELMIEGQFDQALDALEKARNDYVNGRTAEVLCELCEKYRLTRGKQEKASTPN